MINLSLTTSGGGDGGHAFQPEVRVLLQNQARIFVAPISASIPMRATNAHAEAAGIDAGSIVVIVEVDELFARFGSNSVAVTDAVLDTGPGVDGVSTTS